MHPSTPVPGCENTGGLNTHSNMKFLPRQVIRLYVALYMSSLFQSFLSTNAVSTIIVGLSGFTSSLWISTKWNIRMLFLLLFQWSVLVSVPFHPMPLRPTKQARLGGTWRWRRRTVFMRHLKTVLEKLDIRYTIMPVHWQPVPLPTVTY